MYQLAAAKYFLMMDIQYSYFFEIIVLLVKFTLATREAMFSGRTGGQQILQKLLL